MAHGVVLSITPCKLLIGVYIRIKRFARKVAQAQAYLGGSMKYHQDQRYAVSATVNNQQFFEQYLSLDKTSMTSLYNFVLGQLSAATRAQNPAILMIKQRISFNVVNTGNAQVICHFNLWKTRQDIESVAGKTDTRANIIAHGISLVPAQTVGNIATFTSNQVGYNLFLNPFWCKLFKATKTYKFVLQPGNSRHFSFKFNYKFNQTDTPPTELSFFGGSHFVAGFFYGQIGFDQNAHATPTAIGTIPASMIGMVLDDYTATTQWIANKQPASNLTTFNASAPTTLMPIAASEQAVTIF